MVSKISPATGVTKIKAHPEKATVETPSHVREAHAINEQGKQKRK